MASGGRVKIVEHQNVWKSKYFVKTIKQSTSDCFGGRFGNYSRLRTRSDCDVRSENERILIFRVSENTQNNPMEGMQDLVVLHSDVYSYYKWNHFCLSF